tara:strand:- start:444 stop:1076 length:633 start_codon:yes stop_codon:yes gene_type:complete
MATIPTTNVKISDSFIEANDLSAGSTLSNVSLGDACAKAHTYAKITAAFTETDRGVLADANGDRRLGAFKDFTIGSLWSTTGYYTRIGIYGKGAQEYHYRLDLDDITTSFGATFRGLNSGYGTQSIQTLNKTSSSTPSSIMLRWKGSSPDSANQSWHVMKLDDRPEVRESALNYNNYTDNTGTRNQYSNSVTCLPLASKLNTSVSVKMYY